MLEIFLVFLKLGLTSFGGPIAHLGYLRDEFVARRKWIDDAHYADLVALCQFLPGPASSQVGFSIGVLRARRIVGGLAAWLGFTLPSALAMLALGLGAASFSGPLAVALLHALKLVAVAVVAQALWGMTRSLTPDFPRIAIAVAAGAIAALSGTSFGQIGAIVLAAAAGLLIGCGTAPASGDPPGFAVPRRNGVAALVLAGVLFAVTPVLAAATGSQGLALFDAFYRSGALVFGGGHVVLPLLEAEVVGPGWLGTDAFLAGYGLAQAVPGPLFTVAAYLGAAVSLPPNGVPGAVIALGAVFLPGLLLVYGILPFAGTLRANAKAQAATRGANAAVVGILAAAFCNPVISRAIAGWQDVMVAVAGFALLAIGKAPPWVVVALIGATAIVRTAL